MRRSAGRPRHTHRHLTIHTPELSNRGGSFKQCLLAYIYSPFLVFTYSALEPLKIKEGESAIEFSSRCQFVTAQHLGIGVSTVHWKEQHRALQALGYSKVGTLAFCPLSMTPFLPSFLRSFLRSFLPCRLNDRQNRSRTSTGRTPALTSIKRPWPHVSSKIVRSGHGGCQYLESKSL